MLRDILDRLMKGELSAEGAEKAIRLLAVEDVSRIARLDVGRELRHGVPEVVIAEGKQINDLIEIVTSALAAIGRVIVSRVDERQVAALKSIGVDGQEPLINILRRTVIIKRPDFQKRNTGGRVGVITAGTSDIPVAEEVEVMATEMGCEVVSAYDVGVAGVHRVLAPLQEMIEKDVDVIVVVAGREGALPTLLAGIVDVPIIAVPTSFGYGFGEKGVGALMAMLQSCSLGLAVVNIDGGIPAGAVAAMIANRAAKFREREKTTNS